MIRRKDKKGKVDINVIVGLSLLIFGLFSSFIAFMGFVLNDNRLTFIAGILFSIIALIITIVERLIK